MWTFSQIQGEPHFRRAVGTGSWEPLLATNLVAVLFLKDERRCTAKLSSNFRKHNRYHQPGKDAWDFLLKQGEVPPGITRSNALLSWSRTHELQRKYSVRNFLKRRLVKPREPESDATEGYVDYYPQAEEGYEEASSDDNSDFYLEPDFELDEEAILAASADKPLVFEGDWSPTPKPAPLLTLEAPKAGEFEIPADLADYDDGDKLLFSPSPPQEESSSISTNETTEISKESNQPLPSDLVHFRTAWQLVLLCLRESKSDFEGARVSREMKAIVESVERVAWCGTSLDLCPPRKRDLYAWKISKLQIPLYAMRVSDLSINLSPNCNRIMEKISTVGGCHAETINVHCKTGQPTRIDTLLKAINITLKLVLKSNTIPGTHLTMFHCPQEAVATVIDMVNSQSPCKTFAFSHFVA
ncbi:hypothetical protein Pelo_868 [Pelomyxa schiedti]|nr:hypothetical protein Pelo_868 [Pelomyxa schiedti]